MSVKRCTGQATKDLRIASDAYICVSMRSVLASRTRNSGLQMLYRLRLVSGEQETHDELFSFLLRADIMNGHAQQNHII